MKTEKVNLSNNDKIGLITNMSTLFSAGIPILEAVESILEDSKGGQKKVLQVIREDLTQGQHLYTSLSKFPLIFDKVTVNIVKASEEAGTLDVILKDIKAHMLKEIEFTDKVKGALIYPIVILMVFLGVLLVILTFVVPKIATVFQRLKVDLPLPTKIMIYASDLILQYTIPMVIGGILAGIGLVFLYKTNRKLLLKGLLSLPIVRQLAKEIDLTRFSRSLYLLLNAGLPITIALELSEQVVMRKDIALIIRRSREMVQTGKKLSEGLDAAKDKIPNIIIKMTEAGEKSGTLDKSMQEASEFLDYQVSNTLKMLVTLMEPLMLVFVGILVGGMMLAIIAPIYGLIGQVGTR